MTRLLRWLTVINVSDQIDRTKRRPKWECHHIGYICTSTLHEVSINSLLKVKGCLFKVICANKNLLEDLLQLVLNRVEMHLDESEDTQGMHNLL